jgi:prepilin signal peptidase PulO-like enzyme (type II secretory pathway)
MNGGLLLIGILLLLIGSFISVEASTLHDNMWLSFLGSTIDALQQTGVLMAVGGLVIIVIAAMV